jgi:hypothetical protein
MLPAVSYVQPFSQPPSISFADLLYANISIDIPQFSYPFPIAAKPSSNAPQRRITARQKHDEEEGR